MKNLIKNLTLLLAMAALITVYSCKSDDDDEPFTLVSLTAGGVDLNGATAATGVPANANIVATFSGEVDETAVSSSTITLTRDYDDAALDAEVTVSGNTVTIDPADDLGTGTLYILGLGAVKSAKGEELPSVSRNFNTTGNFVPGGQIAYFPLDGNANDEVGAHDPAATGIVSITYGADRKGVASKAAVFDGDQSIIEIPNGDELINSSNFTLSFWVKTNSTNHVNENGDPTGHFVLGIGAFNGIQFEIFGGYNACKFATQYLTASGATTSDDLFFNGDGKTLANGGWQGIEVRKDLTGGVQGGNDAAVANLLKDKWAHIVFVFNSATKRRSMYLNGELVQQDNFNLWPDGDAKKTITAIKFNDNDEVDDIFALGFLQSRSGLLWKDEPWGGYTKTTSQHFKGTLDEVRFFHASLTAQEISLLYNSEKP